MGFSHLHVHTEYSLLDGACRIRQLVDAAKSLGQTALAITDHGVMYGAVEFYKACRDAGIKPIIGCEVYVAKRSLHDKVKGIDNEYSHLVLLCKNETGYKNLIKLVSVANTEGVYYKPRVDTDLLKKYHDGLIALSACLAGEIPKALILNRYDRALEVANEYNGIFGQDNFYIELQNHGYAEQLKILPMLKKLSADTGIPMVVTNDVHYIDRTDSETQSILLSINTGKTLDDTDGLRFETDQFYLKSEEEMRRLFADVPQAVDNSDIIADKCNFDFTFGNTILPHFDIGDKDHFEYLKNMCYAEAKRRYSDITKEISGRIDHELKIIEQMGFVDYFLIVHDFVDHAKKKGIPVGPGRGSGAGSLCAYCIGITDIDPIKYSLIFERFLNPERVTMPDFDIDFCCNRRQEVIDYVTEKYGEDHVSQIVTFDTMAARAAIRNVTRVLGIPYADGDKIVKLIPRAFDMSLDSALESSAELRELYESDENSRRIIDFAKRIEGMPRNISKHAAAVVITRDKVSDYVPLGKSDESTVTQYTMSAIEQLGLLKMDFLGLRNLTVISDASKLINRRVPDFDITKISLTDNKTFKLFSAGLTEGVFQFESAGIKRVLMQLKPDRIDDLIAVTSLYRPGPVKSIPQYIQNRRSGNISYPTPMLEPILKVTYGVLVYQEQVMEVFRSLAGYSLGRADIVRRAMAKKKHDVLESERHSFIYGDSDCEGALKRGVPEEVASGIFDEMISFASYAFNKSHAAAYAHIAYQTAYLKCNYKSEYMAALISSVLDSTDKTVKYINECKRMGVKLLPPDINCSEMGFTVENGSVRIGLLTVKNLGNNLIDRIINERNLRGKFRGIFDFCVRMSGTEINRRALESLIHAGAFDSISPNRRKYAEALETVISLCDGKSRRNISGQVGLFDDPDNSYSDDEHLQEVTEYPVGLKLQLEREAIGFYVSEHPLTAYSGKIKCTKVADILSQDDLSQYDGKKLELLVQCIGMKVRTTKNGKQMANASVEDETGSINAILFPTVYAKYGQLIKSGQPVLLSGTVMSDDDVLTEFSVESAQSADEYLKVHNIASKSDRHRTLYIKVDDRNSEKFKRVMSVMSIFEGDVPVKIYDVSVNKTFLAPRSMFVSLNQPMLDELKLLLGETNIKLSQ